jgi:hypothetical protein
MGNPGRLKTESMPRASKYHPPLLDVVHPGEGDPHLDDSHGYNPEDQILNLQFLFG